MNKPRAKTKEYSDGDDIENSLLDAFRGKDSQKKVEKLLKTGQWPFIYHLHRDRQNIINWYDFRKNASLLEVGAGCGAVTEFFLRVVNKVYTIDISQRRLDILKARFKNYKNLYVTRQNFIEYDPKFKFDYITSIGVLEYSVKYIESENPYLDFLKKVKALLKKNGEFFLAIENKFGFKYWAGAPEDHTGRLFDGIEGYPISKEIQTFSKRELIQLLEGAGFKQWTFYYPFPDYKFVKEIYSDNFRPNLNVNPSFYIDSFFNVNLPKYNIFNDASVFKELIVEDKMDFFSNSFLIIAK